MFWSLSFFTGNFLYKEEGTIKKIRGKIFNGFSRAILGFILTNLNILYEETTKYKKVILTFKRQHLLNRRCLLN